MNNKQESYSKKVAVGAAFMIGTRFSVRLLGLVSVTILARLLTPEDFGVFGTAALVLTFFALLKGIGFNEAVIKTQNLTKADIDTLWTIRLLLAVLTGLSLFLLASSIADFLKEPRIIDVLQLMSLIPVLDSLYSPASSLLLKDFKYKQDFLLKSADKFVRVIAVIILALTLKSYWALVFGSLLASVFGIIVSHIAFPYRPKLTLQQKASHQTFIFWNYWRLLARYTATSADEFIVRASENSATFGIYHVAKDVSRILIAEILSPLGEALLPALVKFSDDTKRFSKAVSDIIGTSLIAGVAVSFGIIATSEEIIFLLLGPQWGLAAQFLAFIAIAEACNALGGINQSIFIAKNAQKYGALFWGCRAVLYTVSCLITGILWGTMAVAITLSIVSFLTLFAELSLLFKITSVQNELWRLFIRPICAGLTMLAGLHVIAENIELNIFALTIIKVTVGGGLYIGTLLSLWALAGRPKGPEYFLIERLPSRVGTLLLK